MASLYSRLLEEFLQWFLGGIVHVQEHAVGRARLWHSWFIVVVSIAQLDGEYCRRLPQGLASHHLLGMWPLFALKLYFELRGEISVLLATVVLQAAIV
jgi:hypothetical protein